jgi:molybdenum cofactor cytidylyltransferase
MSVAPAPRVKERTQLSASSGEHVAGLVLAAGESRRLGRPKQLLMWQGRPLIDHAAHTALEARLSPVVVVVGYHAGDMHAAIHAPVTIVENPRWPEGMSTSLRAGLLALPSDVDAAVMLLVDQPRIGADHLRALVATYRATGKPIVGSTFQGRRGSPTLFDRSLFAALLAITGDEGGRAVIQANPGLFETVEVEDELALLDVDTLEDWQKISNG